MKKFFSYIFTFVAVFLISAVATISLNMPSIGNNNGDGASGQGSPLSFVTDLLNTFDQGKTINLDASLVIKHENEVYGLSVDGKIDNKNKNDIRADVSLVVIVNGSAKHIQVNLVESSAYIECENIFLKANINDLTDIIKRLTAGNSNNEESAGLGVDIDSLLAGIDLASLMGALNNIEINKLDTETIYSIKQDGLIDAEIVMTKENQLRVLDVNSLTLMGIELSLNAGFKFDDSVIQKPETEDLYLDVVKVYSAINSLTNINSANISADGCVKVSNDLYNFNIGAEFNKDLEYASLNMSIPQILHNDLNIDYYNRNIYLDTAKSKLKINDSLINTIIGLLSKNIGIENKDDVVSFISDPNIVSDLNFSNVDINAVLDILSGITVNENQIIINADLYPLLGINLSGEIIINLDEDSMIQSLEVDGDYENISLELEILLEEKEVLPQTYKYYNYLDLENFIDKQIKLFAIREGNLKLDLDINNIDNNFDLRVDAEVNANLEEDYYDIKALVGGAFNCNTQIFYVEDTAYIKYNNIYISVTQEQIEKIYSDYLVPEMGIITENLESEIGQFGNNIASSLTNIFDGISIDDIYKVSTYLNYITINKSGINVDLDSEIFGLEKDSLINIDLVNGEINNIEISDLTINGYVVNGSVLVNKDEFKKSNLPKSSYLNVLDFVKNVYNLKDLRAGSLVLDANIGTKGELFDIQSFIDFDFTNDPYINGYINVCGDLDIDLNVAYVNDEIYIRLFKSLIKINKNYLSDLLKAFGINFENTEENINIDGIMENLESVTISIEDVLQILSTAKISSNKIDVTIPNGMFGDIGDIEVTLNIKNKNIKSISVDNLSIVGVEIDLTVELINEAPQKFIESTDNYLDVETFISSVKDIVKDFGVNFSELNVGEFNENETIDFDVVASTVIGSNEISLYNIVDFVSEKVLINSSYIGVGLDASLIKKTGTLDVCVGLDNSSIEYISIQNGEDLNISFGFDNESYINVYDMYNNILSLQDLRYGNISGTGTYAYDTNEYTFGIDADFDLSNIENIYLNAALMITGSLEVDANIALNNNEIYARLFNSYININIEELKALLEEFGVSIETPELDTSAITESIDTSKLTIENIFASIKKLIVTTDGVDVVIDARLLGFDTELNITIKLDNNDIVGLIVRDLNINGHNISVDLKLDKDKPEQIVENTETYLDATTLLEDVENILANFGVELNALEIKTDSTVDTTEVVKIVEDAINEELNINGILNYVKALEIDSSKIKLSINAEVIKQSGELNIEIKLVNSTVDYITITNNENLIISLAFNDNHEDKINIYTLYNNILSLQDLRYGNVSGTGTYAYDINEYTFGIDADFDLSNIENIYLNAALMITGALEVDANIALNNNEIYARLFNSYLNINVEELKTLLEEFGVSIETPELDASAITESIDTSKLTIENILGAIQKVVITKTAIEITLDANVIGIDTLINVAIKLADDDLCGIIVKEFNYEGHNVNVDLTLDKDKPEQLVENTGAYLNIATLINNVKSIISQLGVSVEAITVSETEKQESLLDLTIVEDVLGVPATVNGVLEYLTTVEINSSNINIDINAEIIKQSGKINIDIVLTQSAIDYVTVSKDYNLSIVFALNDNVDNAINIYTLYNNILSLQDLRYGNISGTGTYAYDTNEYTFGIDADFDLSNIENIYLNAALMITGALEVDANIALNNNEIYARLFNSYLNINVEELKTLLEEFGVSVETPELDASAITESIDTSKLTIENIFASIKKLIVTTDGVDVVIDARLLGFDTELNITIKLDNNDIVGLIVRDLNINGHNISVDLTLDKDKPEQIVENTETYLDVQTLIDDLINVLGEFGVALEENSEISIGEDVNFEELVSKLLGVDVTLEGILSYIESISINSNVIKLSIKSDILERSSDIYITLGLNSSKLDFVKIQDESGLDIALAVNDNHNDMINVITLYNNIVSLKDLRQGTIDAFINIKDGQESLMSLNVNGCMNVDEDYLDAWIRYVSGDVDLSADVMYLNNTIYAQYTNAKLKLTIDSLSKLIGIEIPTENQSPTLLDIINFAVSSLAGDGESLNINISTDQIIDMISNIKKLSLDSEKLIIEVDGEVLGQTDTINVTILLTNNDLAGLNLNNLEIAENEQLQVSATFNRNSKKPTINDSEYFDAYVAYQSILELFDNDDVTLNANGTVYDSSLNEEYGFSVDARKNVVNGKIGAYVLANIIAKQTAFRNHSFQLNYINDELYVNYNTLKARLHKTALTNTVLSVVDLLGMERGIIEELLASVEKLFEGAGLTSIFEDMTGVDLGANITIDESILDIITGLTLTTYGTTLKIVLDGDVVGIDGDIDIALTTTNSKISNIDVTKLNMGGEYVDINISVAPKVETMPTLSNDEINSYWNFNSLEELANMLNTTVNGIETFKLSGNVVLGLGSIEAATVPTTLYVNRSSDDKITVHGKLEIPTSSAAFKEYNGSYHIEGRTSYIYFDGEYLYVHRIDKVRTSVLVWNKNTKDHHFYGKIKFSYFNDDLYSALDFILGFSTTVSLFKNEFNKGGTTDTPPYVENIFKGYEYTADSANNMFDITLSGDALIQNDKIGDIWLRVGKNNQTGMIEGIYAKMTVVSIINVIANFRLERIANSIEFNNSISQNINPNSSSYKNNQLIWAF